MSATRNSLSLLPWPRARAVAVCLLPFLLAACDQPAKDASASPAPSNANAKTWTDLPVSKAEDRVTVHYHRRDGNYDAAGIWTWDGNQKKTPEQNELASIGRDNFGLVFQFDRANYGESDKIGLIPRLGHDWSHKDGGDKFWTPALGNEVWLVSGKDNVLAKQPDMSSRVDSAFIDGPAAIIVNLTDQAVLPVKVSILDQNNAVHAVQAAFPKGAAEGHPAGIAPPAASFKLVVIPKEPLDVVNGHYRVLVEGYGPAVPLVPRGVLESREQFFDKDAQLGAIYTPQSTIFRLFAPTATSVNVVLYDEASGGKGRTVQALNAQPKGLWGGTVNGDLLGKFYAYVLDGPALNPAREVLDPYATNAVASGTRGRITEITAPTKSGPRVASPTDMVIYEMHVRDFTMAANSGVQNRGLYLGFTEPDTHLPDDATIRTALDHLTELGVTHVQLLPVQDFANDEARPRFDWGYIPTAYFSPEGLYSTNPNDDSRVRELKALIDALHARGIGVIMDVVYNHTAPDAPFGFTVPEYYYRHRPDGSLANGSACGNEFRTEAPMARKLIVDSLAFWTKEYGVDGFRFDFMSLIDQETIRQAEHDLRAINPSIVLYGEPWTATGTPLQDQSDKNAMKRLPIGAFNDSFRHALSGTPKGHDAGFIQNGLNRDALKTALLISGWLASPGQSINYLACHDDLVLWDKLAISMPGANDLMMVEAMKLGYLVLYTSQGVPFLNGGEEFARTKNGNNNSYDAPDSVNEIDWSLKRKHLDLFNYTRDVIALRKAHPVFRLRTREDIANRLKFAETPNTKTLMYTLNAAGVPDETWKRVCVVLNGDGDADAEITLPDGQWSVALDEKGTSANRSVTGKVSVRAKSGLVLYQQ